MKINAGPDQSMYSIAERKSDEPCEPLITIPRFSNLPARLADWPKTSMIL